MHPRAIILGCWSKFVPVVYQLDQKQPSDAEAEMLSSLEEVSSDVPGSSASPSLGVSPVSVDGTPFPTVSSQAPTGMGHCLYAGSTFLATTAVHFIPNCASLDE